MTVFLSQIQAFLENNSVESLVYTPESLAIYNKAGIIPFIVIGGERRYCVMKPISKQPELGDPEFQLCKGTRMFFAGGVWQDMKQPLEHDEMESLEFTALREGVEELGLMIDNIKSLYDMGPFGFTSATTGKQKASWMFAAEIIDESTFLPLAELVETTAERKLVTLAEFEEIGRPDHVFILQHIDSILGESL